MNPALWAVGLAVASATMNWRIEPAFPQISSDLSTSLQVTASLASGFGVAYALIQPLTGVISDRYGRPLVMLVGLVVIGLATLACALAPSFEILFICRIIAGAAAGSIAPSSLGLAADLARPGERQVTISRMTIGSTSGAVIGAVFAGGLSDLIGWRAMFGVSAALIVLAVVAFGKSLKYFGASQTTDKGSLSTLFASYKKILLHRTALACFISVFVEGGTIYGMFPYVAAFFQEQGETRLSIAGIVIAAFSIGVFIYTGLIRILLSRFDVRQLVLMGGFICASQMFMIVIGPIWQIQFVCFAIMGFGFYLIHGALQVFVTEVSEVHRGKATALHSFFFFLGQAVGAIVYGFAILHFGKVVALSIGALTLIALGFACSATLIARPQVN